MKSVFLLLTMVSALSVFGQTGQRKSPHDTLTSENATITYGRPYKNGREIFGGLEKYGKVWRLGADEATTITFNKDVKIAGKPVKAGKYSMFAIPNENEWTIILNGEPNQWGAYAYEKNQEKNVARFNLPVQKLDQPVEQLTMRFEGDKAVAVAWDRTQVSIPIEY
jgi:hypothetical protein